jgi:anti-anti-sigma factor
LNILSRQHNGVIIFDIEGDFRRTEIKDVTLHQLVKDQLDLGNVTILLNFARVGTIDSSCVGEIVASYISITNMGGKLLRANTPEKIQIIFEVTGLDRVLPDHESIESALACLHNPNHNTKE